MPHADISRRIRKRYSDEIHCRVCSRLVGCGPKLCPTYIDAFKGVACAQTSILSRNVIKKSNCVHLRKFIVPSAVAVVAISLLRRQMTTSMQKWKRRQKTKMSPVKSTTRSMRTREQQLAKQKMAITRNNHILVLVRCSKFCSLSGTLSTYALSSFSHFVAHG